MRKVAIATMTGGANYGNALQNYAVLRLIERCGYEAETLNISTKNGYPDSIPDTNSTLAKLRPSYIKAWLRGRNNIVCGAKNDVDFKRKNLKTAKQNAEAWRDAVRRKQERFSAFQKDVLKYTSFEVNSRFYNLPQLKQYDAFVTGSDQVWNPHYRTNSPVEFLRIAPREKRIALAPSFGVSAVPDCRKQDYSKWLSEIPYLSVRESSGAEIIRNLTGRDAPVLLDPTFGLPKVEWISFAAKPEAGAPDPGKYVFCYFLGNRTGKYTKYIEKYAAQHNCAVIDVWDIAQLSNYSYSPNEFVWLLANARAVFTDSFHGCAFSLNLQKPFVVFDRAGDGCITQSSRITTVLRKTGLQSRKFETLAVSEIEGIDFSFAANAIAEEREKMIEFLRTSLDAASSSSTAIRLAEKSHCTGCGACADSCPHGAISMIADAEGFLYPEINPDKCRSCHLCEKVCPADARIKKEETTKAYYAFSNDAEICRNSSSGGIFSELAKEVLAEGGIVFGAGFDKDNNVVHTYADSVDGLRNLRTSKYVQSYTADIYRQVLCQLLSGRTVLFTGTPCQVAALKRFLGSDYDNLLLADIICHGVPAPGIWNKYLQQAHGNRTIQSVSFRNKDDGWNDFSMKIEYADGTYYRKPAVTDPFERAFLANLTLRPSCYQCQYKTVSRDSDITLADFWGVETVHPELKRQQGVSLVLTHSAKGVAAYRALDGITSGETNVNRAVQMNSACRNSVPMHTKRREFFVLQERIGVVKAAEKCLKPSAKQRVRRMIVRNGSRVKKVLRKTGLVK